MPSYSRRLSLIHANLGKLTNDSSHLRIPSPYSRFSGSIMRGGEAMRNIRKFDLQMGLAYALLSAAFFAGLTGCVDNRGNMYNPFGTNEFGVPHDSMPPAGLCRVWYPNRPARNQPPPGDCNYLAARLPSGAQLLRGDGAPAVSAAPVPVGSSLPPAVGSTGLPADPNDMRSRQAEDLNRRY